MILEDKYRLTTYKNYTIAVNYLLEEFIKIKNIKKILLIGSISKPLEKEIEKFGKYKNKILYHYCKDLDFAIWFNDLNNLEELRKARVDALKKLLNEKNIGIAHHQIDIFLINTNDNKYIGRLCHFKDCPKQKIDCLKKDCGKYKLLKTDNEDFSFDYNNLDENNSKLLYKNELESGTSYNETAGKGIF